MREEEKIFGKVSKLYHNHIVQYSPEVSLCAGCTSCEAVCAMVHDNAVSPSLSRIRLQRGTVSMIHTVYACQQCRDYPCYHACPRKGTAMLLDENLGIAYVDAHECIGCGLCVRACPFEPKRIRMNLDTPRPKAIKCDMCRTRPQGPACVEFCQVRCIGKSEDPVPEVSLEKRSGLF